MEIVFSIVAIVFVISVLGLVGYALVQVTPLGHHVDHYRDPNTGKRRWESPHLDG